MIHYLKLIFLATWGVSLLFVLLVALRLIFFKDERSDSVTQDEPNENPEFEE